MVHIPRDYYVPIHGIGINDKLTHTGTIGGVNLTMQTIEDLLEIDIPYYVRVNFNSVTNLVDAIGGITVNSDVDYSFTCWTNPSCVIKPGLNELDGKCALAFARERHAFAEGDRQRGKNQMAVIEGMLDKALSPQILKNYTTIWNEVSDCVVTSMEYDEIAEFVKTQLSSGASWDVVKYSVTGSDLMTTAYSTGSANVYVMVPDESTVNQAKEYFRQIYAGEKVVIPEQ
jgi:LCP family protein required for cell wall assembly